MPSDDRMSRWLDPNLTEDEIKALIKPYFAEPMSAYPVSKQFQTMKSAVKYVLDEVPTQQKLEL